MINYSDFQTYKDGWKCYACNSSAFDDDELNFYGCARCGLTVCKECACLNYARPICIRCSGNGL